MKINEIFYSLQGEGYWTGTPMVFVRFSGCNRRCPFCDTRHESYTEMTLEDILREIKRYPAHHVCLTGGEPLLQISERFLRLLSRHGYYIHIETNGTLPLPEYLGEIDPIWVTISPKGDFDDENDMADEIKLLYPCPAPERYHTTSLRQYYLQPIASPDPDETRRNTEATIEYIKAHPHWRLSIQTHKYLNIQ